MRKLIVLGVVLGLLAVVDLSAKSMAEAELEERTAAGLGESRVKAEIRSLPFLPRLLLTNKVSEVHFELEDVKAGSLTLPSVVVDLQGVEIDGDRLRSKREVRLIDIARGRVTIDLTQQLLSDTLKRQITIAGGKVEVNVAGRLVGATPSVQDGKLVLRVDAPVPALTVTIPRSDLIPCVGSVGVLAGRLRVSCALDEIPPALVQAASTAAAGG